MTTRRPFILFSILEVVACAHAPAERAPRRQPPSDEGPRLTPPPEPVRVGGCVESGAVLRIRACRAGDDLAWTITNRGPVDLWVFVAPPAAHRFERKNAFAATVNGILLLRKIQLPLRGMPNPVLSGAIRLAPAASDHGAIPLGARLDPRLPHLWPAGISSPGARAVMLEIGYAPVGLHDQPYPEHARPDEPVVLLGFDGSREQFQRTPALLWSMP